MATDPTKTPLEVIYGGVATVLGVVGWIVGRRKARREYLDYEPVPKIDFEAHKKAMDSKFSEMDAKLVASNAAVLASIQSLREDRAGSAALEHERDKRMERMEDRLNRALDRGRDD